MNIIVKYCFLLTIIFYNSMSLKANYIYQHVQGSLEDSWHFHFRIFSKSFHGVIISVKDSNGNELTLVNNIGDYICASIKKINKCYELIKLCVCSPCNNIWMELEIISNEKQYRIICNNHTKEQSAKELPLYSTISSNTTKISKVNKTIYIEIGNANLQMKEQINACLDYFFYNKQLIKFIENGKKVQSYCSYKCVNNTCNGGICREITAEQFTCDCSNTAYNGEYCNNSMKMYDKSSSNSHEVNNSTFLLFKMTWTFVLKKKYCLLELKRRNESITIWTSTTHVMVGSKSLSYSKINTLYFLTLLIKNNTLLIKMEDKIITKYLEWDEKLILNVGFSHDYTCETYEGTYDEHWYSGDVLNFRNAKNVSKKLNNVQITSIAPLFTNYHMLLIVSVITGATLIIILIVCIIIKGRRQTIHMDGIELQVNNNESRAVYSGQYSVIDYSNLYVGSAVQNTAVPYMEPKRQTIIEDPPTLPPRNESFDEAV